MSSDNEKKPLVAVVTPAYNGAPHIERTLACVQAQTYPNLVHVVLDNASTDATPELIEAAKSGPVPIITKRNEELLAQVPNWNAAIAMTPPEARYVKFLAADDLMRADCIEKMVGLAESDPEIDFVHAIDVFNDEAKPHGLDPAQQIYSGRDYARKYLIGEITWLSATHVFFRVTPERLSNPFSLDIYPFMDNDFIVRELLQHKMGFVFEPLLFTRYDDNTVTASLGGFRSYFLPGFQLLCRYGGDVLAPREFEDTKRRELLKLLRHLVFWQMSGDPKSTATALEGIAELGFAPRFGDYAKAFLVWPLYKLDRYKTQPASPNEHIEEASFLAPERP